jgi:signal transduction histidine kinase
MLHSNSLMPHSICWAADPALIWTMVVTNLATFLSYLTIAGTLIFLVRRTGRILARDWGYFVVGFALFILACGSTHLLEVITTWSPIFWVDAWTNIITALLSAYVAFMLIRRAATIAYGINDYASRLENAETEKHQVEESLVDAQKLRDWSRMSAAVSHEIKNPLQAIQNLQFLIGATEGVSPHVQELARMAGEEAQRVLTLADSTLSFIRQGTEPEVVDVRSAAESVQFLLAPLIRKAGISFHMESTGDCKVVCFPGEIRQVLLNVIRNACESLTESGRRVDIKLAGSAEAVQISVIDQGTGIEPGLLPNIFEFGMTTKGADGNGMGLWTVKRIVTRHRGEVEIHSVRGEGTRVDIWWPRDFATTVEPQRATA